MIDLPEKSLDFKKALLDYEKNLIFEALKLHYFRVPATAKYLKIPYSTLIYKINLLKIKIEGINK
jgi:transcriptional regulator with PAS, ATPase and Fis domain